MMCGFRARGLGMLVGVVWTVLAGHAAEYGPGSRIPAMHGTTFTDVKVDLPEALRGKVGVLVVGFSQGSRDGVTDWGKRLTGDYYDSQTVVFFEMPVLASVPRLLRGFVEGRIKAAVSDRGRVHLLPVVDDEPAWRTVAHYSKADDPYVLVVDESGVVKWQTQGEPTDASYAALKDQVEAVRSQQSGK